MTFDFSTSLSHVSPGDLVHPESGAPYRVARVTRHGRAIVIHAADGRILLNDRSHFVRVSRQVL